jgi:predicted ATPase/class 3 adenylate cyclase
MLRFYLVARLMTSLETGTRAVAALRGTITLLFTDVEGSTRLLQRFGDQSVRMLEEHKSILRATIEEFGGREVDTAGDGFFIVFDVARDGVMAAVEAQRRLFAHEWSTGEPVRVRMGLHTGEPIITGRQYLGLDVHRAARICAAGHGGQILISASTCQLVMNELSAEVGLRDLGEHRLKDIQHPEKLFQVMGAGMPADFPPLRSYGPYHSNLPVQSTKLIGRESEMETLRRLLLDDGARLVTLTGPGGTGKTRLALQAAGSVLDAFNDGISLVQLAATAEAGLVASAIAQALGVHPNADQSALTAVVGHLKSRQLLLVLDNFEHVLGAADVVAGVLTGCPRVKVLATSRIPLNLMLEQEFPVPPLSAPDPRRERSSERLLRYPAIELFAQRAAAVNPSFVLDYDGAAAVAEICFRLDGLPLAIELAAARVKIFTPKALLARLDHRLELLSGGTRDMPARHRTLRQAIGWSYDLLETDEQALFRRLAVFSGGCALDASEVVGEAAGPLSISLIDGVSALVDKSLLRQEAMADGEPRFLMLETIREFALERLVASGEEAITREAHADFFIALAERAEPELTGPMVMTWIEQLEREHDNTRAAFHWAERTQHAARGLRLGGALWRYWVIRGHMTEGRARLRTMLAIASADAPLGLRYKVLSGAATMAHEQSDVSQSLRLLEEALQVARTLGDRHDEGRVLTNLGWVRFTAGDHDAARTLSHQGLAIHRELGDTRGIALALNNLGWITCNESDFEEAKRLHSESLTLRHRIGDARGIAFAQTNLARATFKLGEYAAAERLLNEAIRTLRALGDQQLLSWALINLGESKLTQRLIDEAMRVLQEATELSQEIGHAYDITAARILIGEALLLDGDAERALEHHTSAQEHLEFVSLPWGTGLVQCALGNSSRAAGLRDRAARHYARALNALRALSAREQIGHCLLGLAAIAQEHGDHERAARLISAADAVRESTRAPIAPAWRPSHDTLEAAIRASAGESLFEAARAEARLASWQENVDYALAGLPAASG